MNRRRSERQDARAGHRKAVSARVVPNDIFTVAEVPRTLSGKKLEVPVKKILLGQPVEKVANPDTMANPGSLAWFVGPPKDHGAVDLG